MLSTTKKLLYFFSLIFLGLNLCQLAFAEKGISTKELTGDDIRVERTAKKNTGHFLGLKGEAKLRHFKVNECSFTYEKGLNNHPGNSREYKFERFMISFSGVDKKGENSFDSVTYGHSQYKKDFVGLDFSKSFDFKNITRIELPEGEGVRKLKAERSDMGELSMVFRHQEAYSTGNSSFFQKGEIRNYQVNITFSRFDNKKIALKEVEVKATQKFPSRGKRPTTLVDVKCSGFSNEKTED